MKRIALIFCAASTLLFACNSDKKDTTKETDSKMPSDTAAAVSEKKWIPVDSAMMNKAWAESMAITEQHKMMAKSTGTWNADITMWMEDGAPPSKSTGTCVNTMLFNGLYQQSKHTATMMGMPFEGMGITAYDNTLKKYVATWIDNMGSGILVMTGNWDDASKSLKLSGTMKNPANGLDCTMREEFKPIDDNTQMMTMYGPDGKTGKEYKTMEITYTRKK